MVVCWCLMMCNIKIEMNISSGGLDSSAVERQPFKLVVEGSIPSWGASFCEMNEYIFYIVCAMVT